MNENEIELQKLTQELVRSVRGSRTQGFLNRKLKFSGNQIYRWESGQRSISWKDFVRLTEACKIDLKSLLKEELGFISDPANSKALVSHLKGQATTADYAKALGISRSSVSSWTSGRSVPSLKQVFQLLDLLGFLPQFVERLVPERVPTSSIATFLGHRKKRELQYQFPEVAGVLVYLDLKPYQEAEKHVPGMVAAFMGITVEREQTVLNAMIEAGYLKRNSKGKYLIVHDNLDTRGDFRGTVKLRKFWIERSLKLLDHLDSITRRSRYAHYVISVSKEADEKIKEAMYEYAATLKAIVMADTGDKVIARSVNLQDTDLSEYAEKCV